jgi:tripartite-type tricarboxylate transporter receptor subunit TctC
MKKAARRLFCILAAGLTAMAPAAVAQGTYPSAPIRMIYGYAAGGGGDVLARLLAAKLSAQMNANVFVDNKPGASGHIGNESAAKSKPDGYTMLFNDAGVVLAPALGEKLGYDLFKELAPVSFVAASPFALIVHPSVPSNTAAEFIAYLRANPDKLAYGSAGIGTVNHLGPLRFLQLNGLSALHVPYKGGALMMLDVAAGRVQWAITSLVTVLPLAKEKRIKVLAYGGLKRSPLLPEVPTLSETVMPGFEVGNWNAVMVPAQTPPAIVTRLNGEILKALQDAGLKSRLEEQGAEPRSSTPEEYNLYLKSELERWTKVVKTAGVKVE